MARMTGERDCKVCRGDHETSEHNALLAAGWRAVSERPPVDPLREALAQIERESKIGDHDSIEDGPAFSRGMRRAADVLREALASPAAPRPEGPCYRYALSDGTLCAAHHGRFSDAAATRCAAAPRPEGLDVERLARALEVTGHVGNAHILTLGIDPAEHDDDGCLFRPESLKDATAIAAEYQRLSDTGDTP